MAITKEQRATADSVIEWLNALTRYKKTTNRLGNKDEDGDWRYCCLGVGCRVNSIEPTGWDEGTDKRLKEILGLNDHYGIMKVFIKVKVFDRGGAAFSLNCLKLISANDILFKQDRTFARQRRFMLMTLDNWIEDPVVARSVRARLSKEIRRIQEMSDVRRGFTIVKES